MTRVPLVPGRGVPHLDPDWTPGPDDPDDPTARIVSSGYGPWPAGERLVARLRGQV